MLIYLFIALIFALIFIIKNYYITLLIINHYIKNGWALTELDISHLSYVSFKKGNKQICLL